MNNNFEITGNLAWLLNFFIWFAHHIRQMGLIAIVVVAIMIIGCVVICWQPDADRAEFVHRHDSFKPSTGNALLLGFAGGMALTTIVFIVCAFIIK